MDLHFHEMKSVHKVIRCTPIELTNLKALRKKVQIKMKKLFSTQIHKSLVNKTEFQAHRVHLLKMEIQLDQ
jgi:hypothetical protein